MDLQSAIYQIGFLAALSLCWGLGPVFFYPMLADFIFGLCGNAGWFSGWDIRVVMVTYGLGILVWTIVLSGALTKTTFIAVLMLDVATIFYRILPEIQLNGTGQNFWNATSAGIYEVWLISIFVVVASMAIRSSIVAKITGRRVDLLTNPKKRFLLPIGAWAGIPPLMSCLQPFLSQSLFDNRFVIASHVLVWGWVAFELPPYISHKRLMKQIS